MPHSVMLINTIAAAFGLALVLGFGAARLRLPPLVGYLIAGVVIGPFTPGFIADAELASQLAEIGVMLLMFGVGLHFSWDDLLAVRKIAVPGAAVQMMVATALGTGLAVWWGWPLGGALVFGLSLSVASTVVLLRALEAQGILESHTGRIAVGWLVVEDLLMVLVLVLLPPLAGWLGGAVQHPPAPPVHGAALGWALAWKLVQVGAFVALMLLVGRRLFPWLLWQVARTGSRELFTLCVVATAIGIAFGSAVLFGVSFALGAFFAGMVMRESTLSHRAAQESLPLRDAFAVLFFVSVGMLFNPAVLWDRPLQVAAVVAIILVGKTLAAAALVLAFRYPLNTALTVSASLAQIGEFSFILVALGTSLKMLPSEGASLVLAGSLISMALNPLLFLALAPLRAWLLAHSAWARRLEQRDDPLAELPMSTDARYLARQVVLVGYGRVGRRVANLLATQDVPLVIAEHNRELVESLRKAGKAAVFGNATDPAVLIQAHIARAAMLVIALPDTLHVHQIITAARTLNPQIEVAVRSPSAEEGRRIAQAAECTVFVAEEALAQAIAQHILQRNADRQAHASRPAPLQNRI
ncbi:MAG: cation:proton antiporter [Acidovorax sp.]|uniref:cation:proton antiporter n=1 Tax=Acidovorax sp. TaxID=1872122 RepID=UPI0025BED9F1|nr:cation:proton antiporter [Acidovorax sp.]MCE1194219.1 cation:proton antiporter [Acidovorax sp.]